METRVATPHRTDTVIAWFCCAALVGVLVPERASGEDRPTQPEAPHVTVQAVGALPCSGRLAALGSERVELVGPAPPANQVAVADLIRIEIEGQDRAPQAAPAWLLFPNGDRVSAQLLGMEHESLHCRWRSYPAWEALRVPLETVTGIELQPVSSPAARSRLLRDLAAANRNHDELLLTNRDTLAGELLSISPERCELQTTVGMVAIETSAVRGVALNPELVNLPVPDQPSGLVRFADGSWLTLTELHLASNAELGGRTLFGANLHLPLNEVRRIDFFGTRVVSLAALTPTSVELRPWLSPARSPPLSPNRNVRGGFLSVRGAERPRGWGLTSAARVTFRLEGKYTEFQATIGIDDAAAGGGNAVFGVELDQRRVYTSPLVTGRSRGAVEMTLVVEYGESGDILDYADWFDAILVREPVP
jgi:hypothetical protein